MGPCLFLQDHRLCRSHRKTCWSMYVDNVGHMYVDNVMCLLWTSNSMVTLTFFPWCKPKWSRVEFNNQLQILQRLGTASWSMV